MEGEKINNSKTINELLEAIAETLNINNEMRDRAISSYTALGTYLDNNIDYKVDIYAQGSFKLGTIIKPINEEDDYDIDLVCEIQHNFDNAAVLKNTVGKEIKNSPRYSKMLKTEEGKRCWTLEYNDAFNFHMDVLPAMPYANATDEKIRITNFENGIYSFKHSNPTGYAKWFLRKCELDKNNTSRSLVEDVKKAEYQPPRSVLQKTIQLLKRHRDVIYSSKSEIEQEDKPISIIITTLVAHLYTGQESIYELLNKFVNNYKEYIKKDSSGNDYIENPVDTGENFADKWIAYPKRRTAFYEWVKKVEADLINDSYYITDRISQANHLKSIFGADTIKKTYILLESNAKKSINTNEGKPHISSENGKNIKPHHFYGK